VSVRWLDFETLLPYISFIGSYDGLRLDTKCNGGIISGDAQKDYRSEHRT